MKKYFFIIILIIFVFNLKLFSLNIEGEFNGWDGETVIKLSDGTFWIQSSYYYSYCYAYNPKVELFREFGQIKIKVNGCGARPVAIEQIEAYETRIDGEFDGFDDGKIFYLQNGTVWKQKKFKYWYRYAYSPRCLLYYYNGWKLNVLGKTIDVERIR